MEAANLVPSLDVCVRLKEAGFEQNTLFGWCNYPGIGLEVDYDHDDDEYAICAAPLLTELLAVLPITFEGRYGGSTLEVYRSNIDGEYGVGYPGECIIEHPNPAEAAARLWLSLREQEVKS